MATEDQLDLILAAQGGDQDAYGRLIEPHRAELRAHCYRMLGSTSDAEDALQEALVRAWRGLGRFEGRSSLRTWLYRIATNACLKVIDRRSFRVLPIDYGPAADPHDALGAPLNESVWIDPYPTPEGGYERLESVELAFIAALQHLAAGPRAVLILRDVLGFSGAETADLLGLTPAAVYSALQRAHKTVDKLASDRSQQATLHDLGDGAVRQVVDRYVAAWEHNDVDALVSMLTEDAVFSMPPLPNWYRGREVVGAFLAARPLAGSNRYRVVPTRANGQLAFGHYQWDQEAGKFMSHGVSIVTMRGALVSEITAFLEPGPFAAFGLPPQLD